MFRTFDNFIKYTRNEIFEINIKFAKYCKKINLFFNS
jgi:hypothetical protein